MVADLDAGCERSRGREELQERLKDSEERDYRRTRFMRLVYMTGSGKTRTFILILLLIFFSSQAI